MGGNGEEKLNEEEKCSGKVGETGDDGLEELLDDCEVNYIQD